MKINVTLPPGFVAIRYPGYYWHVQEQALYSAKVYGTLRKLSRQYCPPYIGTRLSGQYYYQLSVKNKPKYISYEYLCEKYSTEPEMPTQIPMHVDWINKNGL